MIYIYIYITYLYVICHVYNNITRTGWWRQWTVWHRTAVRRVYDETRILYYNIITYAYKIIMCVFVTPKRDLRCLLASQMGETYWRVSVLISKTHKSLQNIIIISRIVVTLFQNQRHRAVCHTLLKNRDSFNYFVCCMPYAMINTMSFVYNIIIIVIGVALIFFKSEGRYFRLFSDRIITNLKKIKYNNIFLYFISYYVLVSI